MKSSFIILVIFTFGDLLAADKVPPIFSNSYTTKGKIIIKQDKYYTREIFQAWYDGISELSRIDYQGGTHKTIQLSKEGEYGTNFQYVRDESPKYRMNKGGLVLDHIEHGEYSKCSTLNGTKEDVVSAQKSIPDTTGFKACGEETIKTLVCEKWCKETVIGNKTVTHILLIHYKKTGNSSDTVEPIPVKYDVKAVNKDWNEVYDYYYIEYEEYDSNKPNADVFKIPENVPCKDIILFEDRTMYYFNPMKEFIDGYDKHMESAFESFKKHYNKTYKTMKEEQRRKEVFSQNIREMYSRNRKHMEFTNDIHENMDLTNSEMLQVYFG